MRSNTAVQKLGDERFDPASSLLRESDEATNALNACLTELEEVLAQPELDASALTSVRLKLAGIRLTRGPLITRFTDFLAGRVSEAEQAALDDLRSSHRHILKAVTVHTSKWTLDAISGDWLNYRRETQALVRNWRSKSDQDARLVYPLIKKAIDR